MSAATIATGVGGLILGFVLGSLAARRGRRLHIDWHLQVQSDEGNDKPDS